MELIQLLGSRNKSDFAIYLGHTIAALGYRVLIADATNNSEYLHSYIQIEDNEHLYELQDVEILINTKNIQECVENLSNSNEALENFDYVIVDANDSSSIVNDWPKFQHVFYISDNTRSNITQDIDILNDYVDSTGKTILQRIHFESAYKIPNDYIDLLINNRVEFKLVEDPLEYDDQEHKLRNYMQHESSIPYAKLPKDYKRLLKAIVTELLNIGNKDFEASMRRGPLRMLFGRFKSKEQVTKRNEFTSEEDEVSQDGRTQPRLVLNNVSQGITTESNKSGDKMTGSEKTKEVVGG
ncbi:hypothetical protein [Lysinibacillus xylanilyticus]|uniref:AAA domain-containing protein n=1 Tax=Lysinibacillus xylanilyticus TaxID=582475 RepID=A0A2M9Q9Z6_9BACI|nr:hypothetical protein [Lysinibacillus xylanilyticus]PJO44903.1 hypothetical protein CWD94_04245 [Lysinibacillus xylanilyticus]